jgi:hypothetical protein
MASDEDASRRIFDEHQPATIRAGDLEAFLGLRGGPDLMWCPQKAADVCRLDTIRTGRWCAFRSRHHPCVHRRRYFLPNRVSTTPHLARQHQQLRRQYRGPTTSAGHLQFCALSCAKAHLTDRHARIFKVKSIIGHPVDNSIQLRKTETKVKRHVTAFISGAAPEPAGNWASIPARRPAYDMRWIGLSGRLSEGKRYDTAW